MPAQTSYTPRGHVSARSGPSVLPPFSVSAARHLATASRRPPCLPAPRPHTWMPCASGSHAHCTGKRLGISISGIPLLLGGRQLLPHFAHEPCCFHDLLLGCKEGERERVSVSGGDCALGCVTLPLLALLPASEAADLHCCERVPCGAGGPTPPRSAVLCAVTHVCP